jgi:hypothetical protein
MSWAHTLKATIILNDGREISTLRDARALIGSLRLRHQSNELWVYVDGLLLQAAFASGSPESHCWIRSCATSTTCATPCGSSWAS